MTPSRESLLRPQDLWTLLDASNQLHSFATLDRALRLILDIAARMTDSQAGSVILHDQPRSDLDLELVARFGEQAAVAVHHARMFELMISSSGLLALPDVRDDLIAQLLTPNSAPIRERLTVFFADMRSFTRLATAVVRA